MKFDNSDKDVAVTFEEKSLFPNTPPESIHTLTESDNQQPNNGIDSKNYVKN